jgi:AraC family transcriptional regulator
MEQPIRPTTHDVYNERILRVLMHLQKNLDQPVDLAELARLAHFSPFHFHHVFRGMVGESIAQHVRRLRLERAAGKLKATDQPVTQIAFDAGYEAHESFTRAFGAMFGCSPSEFRSMHQKLAEQRAASSVHYDPEGKVDFRPARTGSKLDVRIERIPARRVAFVRHVGPYEQVGAAWQKLMNWAGSRGLFVPGMLTIGICYDDPEITSDRHVRYDACLATSAPFEPQGEIGAQEIPAAQCAVVMHRGPYEKLGEAYGALFGQWLPSSGREPSDAPAYDLYRNSPFDTAPENLLTDIHLPLKPERS